jgi:hypothetical protein
MKQHMHKLAKILITIAPVLALSGYLSSNFFWGEADIPKSILTH